MKTHSDRANAPMKVGHVTLASSPPGRLLIALAACSIAALVIYLVEQSTTFIGTRLVEGLVVLAALGIVAWAAPNKFRNTLVVACSLVFGFIVLEGALLVAGAVSKKSSKGVIAHNEGLVEMRPTVGWGPARAGVFKASKIADGKVIYDTHVTIDAALNRKTIPSGGPGALAFFGDSWIFGDGVEDDGTLPQAFADLTHREIPVLNLGFNGWNPAVNLATLETHLYSPILREPRHFILFTATFHLERIACKGDYATSQAPRYIVNGESLQHTGTCAQAVGMLAPAIRFLRKFELYNRFAPKLAAPEGKDVETYIRVIKAFVTTAQREYGAKTTVLFAPFQNAYLAGTDYSEEAIINKLRSAGVDVLVDKLPPTDNAALYWIPGDGHPTALANKVRAQEVLEHLRQADPEAVELAGTPR